MALPDYISKGLWAFGSAALGLIFVIAVARRVQRIFPAFFAYLLFEVMQSILLWLLVRPPFTPGYTRFFYTFWVCQFLEVALSFAVITELFASAFRPYPGLRRVGLALFRIAAVLLVVAAILVASWAPGSVESPLLRVIMFLDRSISIVQCGLMLFLLAFCSYLNLTWKHHLLGIALGFGLIASANLAADAMRLEFGSRTTLAWDFIRRGGYDLALVLWIAYLLRREPSPVPVRVLPKNDFAEWDAALLQILQR